MLSKSELLANEIRESLTGDSFNQRDFGNSKDIINWFLDNASEEMAIGSEQETSLALLEPNHPLKAGFPGYVETPELTRRMFIALKTVVTMYAGLEGTI